MSGEKKNVKIWNTSNRLEKKKKRKNVRHKTPELKRKNKNKEIEKKARKGKKEKIHCSLYKFYVFLCRF